MTHVTTVTTKNSQTTKTPTLLCCFIFQWRNYIKSTRQVSNLLVVHLF